MRKNLRLVLTSFQQERTRVGTASIWTDGASIFSYNTCILTRLTATEEHPLGQVVRNMTKYSHTTTEQQNSLALEYEDALVLEAVPLGSSADTLRRLARWIPAGEEDQ